MAQPLRVVHYINQFFGGMGGEEAANVGVSLTPGTVGASRALQHALGQQGTVIGTLIAGDNYVNEQHDAAMAAITAHLRALQPDVVMAGRIVVALATGVKNQPHQHDTHHKRHHDADGQGGIAVAGHLDVGFEVPTSNANPPGPNDQDKQNCYEELRAHGWYISISEGAGSGLTGHFA